MVTKKRSKVREKKPRNAGTMTESQFWAFIRSALRQKSRWWKPISVVKFKARRPYKQSGSRRKFEYQCNHCKKWFFDNEVNVDHIDPAGQLNCANDLPRFVERLFCEENGLQLLCTNCHDIKTKNELINNSKNEQQFKNG